MAMSILPWPYIGRIALCMPHVEGNANANVSVTVRENANASEKERGVGVLAVIENHGSEVAVAAVVRGRCKDAGKNTNNGFVVRRDIESDYVNGNSIRGNIIGGDGRREEIDLNDADARMIMMTMTIMKAVAITMRIVMITTRVKIMRKATITPSK